jgi:hypothetical protein
LSKVNIFIVIKDRSSFSWHGYPPWEDTRIDLNDHELYLFPWTNNELSLSYLQPPGQYCSLQHSKSLLHRFSPKAEGEAQSRDKALT